MSRRLLVAVCCALALLVGVEAAAAAPAAGAPAAAVKAKRKKCKLKRHARCRRSVIRGASIGKRNLAGSNLQHARIVNTTFTRTDLRHVSFKGATLRNVTFRHVDLAAATFRGATLRGVRFDHAEFASSTSTRCVIEGSIDGSAPVAFGCDLSGTSFAGATLKRSYLMYSDLSQANFSGATLDDVDFRSVSLKQADFTGSTWRGTSAITDDGAVVSVGIVPFTSNARMATFDGSSGVLVRAGVDVSFASFLDAVGAQVLATGDDRRGLRGLGAKSTPVAIAAFDDAAASDAIRTFVIERSRTSDTMGFNGRTCMLQAPCTLQGYLVDAPLRLSVESSARASLIGPGIACDAPYGYHANWLTRCTGTASAGLRVLQYRWADSHTVTVRRDSSMGGGVHPVIALDVLAADGAVLSTTTCASIDDAACVVRVPDGLRVRVTASVVAGADVLVTLNCPGVTPAAAIFGSAGANSHASCTSAPVDADFDGLGTVST